MYSYMDVIYGATGKSKTYMHLLEIFKTPIILKK